MLFFVLSGYVLALSLRRSGVTLDSTRSFYVRRLFRIYPAALAASAFGLAARLMAPEHHDPVFSNWFNAEVQHSLLSFADLGRCFLTLKADIIPPLWSIRVELICSALIPLLVLAARKGFAIPITLILIGLTATGLIPSQLLYLVCFSLGVTLTEFDHLFARLPLRTPLMIAAIAILLFGRLASPMWRFEVGYGAVSPILFESAAAMILIGCIASGSLPGLRAQPLVWLGDISYSIYIWHFPVMTTLAFALSPFAQKSPTVDTLTLMGATLVVTLILSHASYRLLEIPGIKLGAAVQKMGKWQKAQP